ncbi:MAG: hypothetical protein AAFP19_17605 [Bacteroidota bacterium]
MTEHQSIKTPAEAIPFDSEQYISVPKLLELFTQLPSSPYQSRFSIEPLVEHYQEQVINNFGEQSTIMAQRIEDLKQKIDSQDNDAHLSALIHLLMPSTLMDNRPVFISPPLVKVFKYKSPALNQIFDEEKWQFNIQQYMDRFEAGEEIILAGILILNQFYDQQLETPYKNVMSMYHTDLGVERYFELMINFDYIRVEKTKALKELSQKDIYKLLNNLEDKAFWLECFPPDHFVFYGFGMGEFVDITADTVRTNLKDRFLVNQIMSDPFEFLHFASLQLRSYFSTSTINVGFVDLSFTGQTYELPKKPSISQLSDRQLLEICQSESDNIYSRVYRNKSGLFREFPSDITSDDPIENALIKEGIKSILLIPLHEDDGRVNSIMEIGSTQLGVFNALTLTEMEEIINLFQLGRQRFDQEVFNRTNAFIRKQYTAIHPSVEWRFEQVALDHEMKRSMSKEGTPEMEEIVFKNIFPLYGQADIVSSSNKRNHAIQQDLIHNLELVSELMATFLKEVNFHLLEAYYEKVMRMLSRLKKHFVSSDETTIVDLITKDIHPLLHRLKERFDHLPQDAYEKYFNSLDGDLDIIYRQRKNYEESVNRLNQVVADFIEQEDESMQRILPHYFERYKTDGVEYNLYLGQSLLEYDQFDDFDLRNFRIWQLEMMCKATQLVRETSSQLPVPLETAQLIFVYNNPLSIRFRMDDKQFDVDGTYNVRYEILKKRIDKARVKGRNERLTLAGKIAIVYLQEKDRKEYLGYLEHLKRKGLITDDIEDLELEKLQGAEGLHALRVTCVDK